ncbi:MAG: AIPR family protein [Brevundimonas sp.]|uniref:AIPR family protein n=1 Tax=Brevundimonas sp. TaxID=1871086 RepID=UPI00271EC590|nr:AIPR family protein [Brevundimonas sp.]MDO9608646.1 AIPR family protein [Brevundimonas sp.]
MHRVVQNHLADFSKKYSIDWAISKQFEAFVNYAALRSLCAEGVDPRDLVYEGDDPGIDGVMVFLDDVFVSSTDEIDDFFAGRKRDVEATIIFTQAKTGESWNKSDINNFQSAVVDFLSDEHQYPHSEYIRNSREVFDAVLKNVGKLRGGKPQARCYFANTARVAEEREILAAREALERSVGDTGYFSTVEAKLLDRDAIIVMWAAAEGQVEATLKVIGLAAFPKAPQIEQGYVLTVKAKDFIEQILSDANGRLRQRIFEENVRDFIGLDGEINSEISETLRDVDKQKRFGVLNNGITIISPDVRVSSLEIYLRDFQIVNGCQTSNVLFENRASVTDDTTLMLKIVETSDANVVDDIVRSTNRQAKVEEDQFLATLDSVKALERYFDARGQDEEYRLYFERRKNQFASHDNVKAIRVFDIKEIARCAGAMFLDKPDVASRYPNRLTGELKNVVFDRSYAEDIYHVAAYTLYRVKLLTSNGKIDPKYFKLRWHILMAIKYYVLGASTPQLNSGKIKAACAAIEKFISSNDEAVLAKMRDLCAAIVDINDITRDRIKTETFVAEVRTKALAQREVKKP